VRRRKRIIRCRRTWPGRGRRAAALGKDAAGSCREKLEGVEIMGERERGEEIEEAVGRLVKAVH
jgi:hypothetical protein